MNCRFLTIPPALPLPCEFPLFDPYEHGSALTPTQLQIVALIPWRFGDVPAERHDSFVFVRIQAFASKAAFAALLSAFALVTPWSASWSRPRGNPSPPSCPAGAFPRCWIAKSRHRIRPLLHRGISTLTCFMSPPQLSAANLAYTRLPRACFTYLAAPVFLMNTHPPTTTPEETAVIHANVDRAQELLFFPAHTATPRAV